jgi:hypothetical protein
LSGYFLTEFEGETLKLFPIDKELRYAVPFRPVEESLNYLKERWGVRTLFDDGEKFGLWPQTYRWVYEEGWLREFLRSVETVLPQEAARERASGLAYLSQNSYEEMGKWCLPTKRAELIEKVERLVERNLGPDAARKGVRRGTWKLFLRKYHESNYMHKRNLLLCRRTEPNEETAKAQFNDVYWHGVFGGLYLPNLRDNYWRFTAKATEEAIKRGELTLPLKEDFNLDGLEEVLCKFGDLVVAFWSLGGSLIELLNLKEGANYQSVVSRYLESYHLPKPKEGERHEGIKTIHEIEEELQLKEPPPTDWHPKVSFLCHFLYREPTLKEFLKEELPEFGDFVNQPFEVTEAEEGRVSFRRVGGLYYDGKWETEVEKSYSAEGEGLNHLLKVKSSYPKEAWLLLELNLRLPAAKTEVKEGKGCVSVFSKDYPTELKLQSSKPFKLLSYPIKTVHKVEGGITETLQGITLGLLYPFKGELSLKVKFEVSHVGT